MASCIGALKRVRDYVPNIALQSILNSPVQPHFCIIIVALPGTVGGTILEYQASEATKLGS